MDTTYLEIHRLGATSRSGVHQYRSTGREDAGLRVHSLHHAASFQDVLDVDHGTCFLARSMCRYVL